MTSPQPTHTNIETAIPAIAVFDIGKTNKKFFLFNERYGIELERSVRFDEALDDEGFPCEDVQQLTQWVNETMNEILALDRYNVRAVNFSAYGASFVLLDEEGMVIAPLYNYLKPYPPALQHTFYESYGGEGKIATETASPVLGNLNSGLQLYRLKYERVELFERTRYALHLPQYISYIISRKPCAEITSIGCHTALWDFRKRMYHDWVYEESIDEKFPPVLRSNTAIDIVLNDRKIKTGVGLHDSSAALIPYLASFSEPFILLSTGTWSISLNPFNNEPLTEAELRSDCLCYLEYKGRPVKASRLFAGNEHEQQVKRLAAHYQVEEDRYMQVDFNPLFPVSFPGPESKNAHTDFSSRDLRTYATYDEAYHQLIVDLVTQQQHATSLIFSSTKVSRIFVDGGFAKNKVYMHMLAAAFPWMEIYAASVSQATALGAALAIHHEWNEQPLPGNLVEMELILNQ